MPNPHTLGNNHRIQMAFVPAEVLDCLKLTFGQFFEDIANMKFRVSLKSPNMDLRPGLLTPTVFMYEKSKTPIFRL